MNTGQSKTREEYEADPIFQRLQWEVRRAFEEGWRAAGGNPEQSPHYEQPRGWRLAWLNSKSRAFLVVNNLISGQDGYK